LNTFASNFKIIEKAEITIEVNPDDCTEEYLMYLAKNTIVNRLSIGIQSFNDTDLQLMGRRHNSAQAIGALETSARVGFQNISADLIYGIPNQSIHQWISNLDILKNLPVQHLSAYHLTFEPNTVFDKWRTTGKLKPVKEEQSIHLLETLLEKCKQSGFEQYEISNFARKQMYSKHNTNYWRQKAYLGIGPSAHSYNRIERAWNVSNIHSYINGWKNNKPKFDTEKVTADMAFNEYIMLGLRTKWGIDLRYLRENFSEEKNNQLQKDMKVYLESRKVRVVGDTYIISEDALITSDAIISDLMQV
jgi:oxygen-independent coproporphyrinogen-3 oxidase